MRRKNAALAVSKSAQISKLLGEGLEVREVIKRGFTPQLVYQVKSNRSLAFRRAQSTANERHSKSLELDVPARPVSLIVNGLEVTIANGTAEQVGKIAAALIS